MIKPVVDRIEREHQGKLLVVRLNVQEAAGRIIAPEYRFQYTPTFIFINSQGQEVWRSIGSVDPEKVRQSLK